MIKLESKRLKRIFVIAGPIMGGMVSQNVLNLVDTAFVGRLGDVALAAVGMGAFANWLVVSGLVGMGAGVQAIASRRMGEGKQDQTASGLNSALIISVLVGVPIAALGILFATEYFSLLNDDPAVQQTGAAYVAARFWGVPFVAANFAFRGFWNGIGKSVNYLITLLFIHTINIFLSYGLIFGHFGLPEMGAEGAGWGSAIAIASGTVFYFALAFRAGLPGGFLAFHRARAVTRTLIRLSLPASFQSITFSGGFVVFFIIAGKIGTDALAASNVLVNLNLVCVLPGLGLGLAGATLVGSALGAGDRDDARRWGSEVAFLGSIFMGLLGLVLVIGRRFWLGIFIVDSPDTLALAVVPLTILGLGQVLDGIGVVLAHVLTGVGDTMSMLKISLFCQWVLFIPSAWILTVELGYGTTVLWSAFLAYRLLVAAVVWRRYRSERWMDVRV